MRSLFELTPLILAVVACVLCGMQYHKDRRRSGRVAMVLASLSSVLLVVAQASWWASVSSGSLFGTEFANGLWTVFNNLVMVSFILLAWPRAQR